jgi:hypothetical protein
MIPLLLITRDKQQAKKYIEKLVTDQKIKSFNTIFVEKEDSGIKIDQIRDIQKSLTRAETEQKLVAIFDFDTAKDETQNAFLKTLEEKSEAAQFVIVARDRTSLLGTIVSRCKVIVLEKGSLQKVGKTTLSLEASLFDNLKTHTFTARDKDKALATYDEILESLPTIIIDKPHFSSAITKLIELRTLIDINNVNPQIAIDQFFIEVDRLQKKAGRVGLDESR